MRWLASIALMLTLLIPLVARAVEPGEELADPKLEARARAISAELRCLVCQNESIDTSEADLARDLRHLVRERLKAGDSDQQVKAFIVERYGEFVLLKPKVDAGTSALWFGPFGLLFVGLAVAYFYFQHRRAQALEGFLTGDEERRLGNLTDVGRRWPDDSNPPR
ncbi:MAG: cytochrome c-type biogenesis protein CcmH [Alphaproteobacteria bacterium]|nr:cytochrome c-type biogenesis protein CcmH [Alphaproteobacteria bacterium]